MAMEMCERETIEVATRYGLTKKPAWRLGDLAVHQGLGELRDYWTVTHLPTGLGFSSRGVFQTCEAACAAMAVLCRKVNSWAVVETEDLPRLAVLVREIFDEIGAVHPPRVPSPDPRPLEAIPRINSYAQAPSA